MNLVSPQNIAIAGAVLTVLALVIVTLHAKRVIRLEKARTFGFLIGACVGTIARLNSADVSKIVADEISRVRGNFPREELERLLFAAALLQVGRMDSPDFRAALADIGGEGVRDLSRAAAGVNKPARELAQRAIRIAERVSGGTNDANTTELAGYSVQELFEAQLLIERVATNLYASELNPRLFDRNDFGSRGVQVEVLGRVLS